MLCEAAEDLRRTALSPQWHITALDEVYRNSCRNNGTAQAGV